jgi:hypothetical protein
MLNIFLAIMITTVIAGADIARTPHSDTTLPSPAPTVIPTSTPIPTDIVGYISYKFGDDAWKAFRVLDCENKTLDPERYNDNRTWGGVGVDRGYWQINNVYHPISDSCAKDVKCSTDYAFRMYSNDDNTFVRWACGKKLGL